MLADMGGRGGGRHVRESKVRYAGWQTGRVRIWARTSSTTASRAWSLVVRVMFRGFRRPPISVAM